MKIVLGVTGSIAAYKAYDVVRYWVKNCAHEVRVVLTSGALKFVVPEVFKYLGAKDVYGPMDDFDISLTRESWGGLYDDTTIKQNAVTSVLHIELAKWCDRMIVAPLSANTMARLSQGQAPDLLTSTFLAITSKPVILYPAMNTNMLEHSFTQENIARLKTLSNIFVHPTAEGILACGDVGRGKLPDVDVICELATMIPVDTKERQKKVSAKKILITTGATISPLDPVRYLTNSSSGITGYYLAKKFLQEGHEVTVIAGIESTPKLDYLRNIPGYKLQRVITPQNMVNAVFDHFKESDVYISSAAIGDMEFNVSTKKIKKNDFSPPYNLEFRPTIDILAEVLRFRREDQKIVGFAAETVESQSANEINASIFITKWERKKVDLLVGNFVDNGFVTLTVSEGDICNKKGFVVDKNEYYFIKDGEVIQQMHVDKENLANKIFDMIKGDR